MEDPVGDDTTNNVLNEERSDELSEAMNVCRLARAKHECGDFFSVGAPTGVAIFELECYKGLSALPGVFVVEFEAGGHRPEIGDRYSLLTNAQWMVLMSTIHWAFVSRL